ncbi:MAG TPA: UDP-N-acetylmuramoyl-tripeptide--D-alanyl-D-alanine ligase [Telluria sp.]|nr:UDP-N-acetylmuramoyl-tripeptide--D-alanyl-D-alanine ligase [Telluria sp.]
MRGSLAHMIASMPGARMTLNAKFDGVSTDSRTATPGSLFVALKGENFDAHDYLEQVAARGVAAVVVNRVPAGWTLPAIIVPDTLAALGQIGNFWRSKYSIPLIGVTGSNGKTTVKEMIAAILAQAHGEDNRLATQGNLNNEIGVPLTLMRLAPNHKSAVVELGMNHPGEIGRLTKIAAPTIGMVNNAQREHQEFMHTVEAVARENGCVIAGLPEHGVAVFPGDDEYTPIWRELAEARGERKVITFGLSGAETVSATHIASAQGSELTVTVREGANAGTFTVRLNAAGLHNVRNALAAIACACAAGIGKEDIVAGLESFAPVSGRLQRKQAASGVTVIDDSYNANPDSVRAAIDVLAQAPSPRILVLGDMGEVGTQGPEFHREIGDYAASRGIDCVLATGELARHMRDSGAQHFDQFDDLLAALDQQLGRSERPGDATVLVKGSRFMKMERVVQHLLGTQNTGKEAH